MAPLVAMGDNLMVSLWLMALLCCAYSEHKILMKSPSRKRCEKFLNNIFWISEDESAIVLGKSDEPIKKCELTFGVQSNPKHEKARLRVEFEVFYIHDCGVEVQINESSDSVFSQAEGNHLMVKSNCNTRKPAVLYARPKNFIRVWWYKKDKLLEAYNFRLNISMIDGLPVVGPAFSTLVIVGLIMFLVVCLAATLFFKYLAHVSQSWHERSVENRMDRAICLYNSQEPLPEEPDHVCLQPGHMGERRQMARFRPREPEIAFVHRDGRVERFRPLASTPSSSEQLGSYAARGETELVRHAGARIQEPQRARSQIAGSTREAGACGTASPDVSVHHKILRRKRTDHSETSSLAGCELPPTYEEAIGMPVAVVGASQCEGSPTVTEPTTSGDSNQELDREATQGGQGSGEEVGRQEKQNTSAALDYVNVFSGATGRPHEQGAEDEGTLSESTIEAPLLPRGLDSSVQARRSPQDKT